MYRIERQDQLYQTLPRALLFSPIIVVFSVLALLLPLSGVFAPGSLTITQNFTHIGPCMIPTATLSTPETTNEWLSVLVPEAIFSKNNESLLGFATVWTGVTPRAMALTMQCLIEQRIPDLPQVCGPNCRYKVSVPSIVFQCVPNPPSLPYFQGGYNNTDCRSCIPGTYWNATTDPTSMWGFYIAWMSNGKNGTSGNASCSPVQAQYDVEVRTIASSTRFLTHV